MMIRAPFTEGVLPAVLALSMICLSPNLMVGLFGVGMFRFRGLT